MNYKVRTCHKCGETKSLDLFEPANDCPEGRRGTCKKCRNQYRREHSYPKRKLRASYQEQHRRASLKYLKANPLKTKAHRLAKSVPLNAICEGCGVAAENMHRHHPDYSKPLEVLTLCVPCHEKAHHGVLV